MSSRPRRSKPSQHSCRVFVQLNQEERSILNEAAALRGINVPDYIRKLALPQARREVAGARQDVVVMSADEQLKFWKALQGPSNLTSAQKKLGAIARGKK